MAKEHKCKKSDHISKVAKQHGFKAWKTVWNQNKELQNKRKDPNVLFKGNKRRGGDVLKLPDLEGREDLKILDELYAWNFLGPKLMLRLRVLKDDFSPLKDAQYELRVPGRKEPYTDKTKADGKIEHKLVKMDSQTATLTIRVKPEDTDPPPPAGGGDAPAPTDPKPVRGEVPITWELQIGALNPIKEEAPDERCVSGVQQRLNNLNMNSGPVDGKLGPNTKAAVKAFQELYEKEIPVAEEQKGIPDKDKTQEWLYKVHDAPGDVPKPSK